MERAEKNGLKRELRIYEGKDFISNDYLGLTTDLSFHKILKEAVAQFDGTLSGSGGSRLLGGHKKFYEKVEERLAHFSQAESALFVSSGYQTNLALFSCLASKGDIFLSDQYNHASLVDGMRLSQGEKIIYKHNDTEDLATCLRECGERYKNIFIVCESIYSMEGTPTPLSKISELAEQYGAKLIVDESHATGLFGSEGSGLINELGLREQVLCTIHTAGKALGVAGAWIAGSDLLKQYLIHFSRGIIYSTAPSPVQFLFVDESIRYLNKVIERSKAVLRGSDVMREKLKKAFYNYPVGIIGQNSPIIPIVLGDNQKVVNVSLRLREKGFAVAGVRYPTVPEGSARLRISMNYNNVGNPSEDLLNHLIPSIKEVL